VLQGTGFVNSPFKTFREKEIKTAAWVKELKNKIKDRSVLALFDQKRANNLLRKIIAATDIITVPYYFNEY